MNPKTLLLIPALWLSRARTHRLRPPVRRFRSPPATGRLRRPESPMPRPTRRGRKPRTASMQTYVDVDDAPPELRTRVAVDYQGDLEALSSISSPRWRVTRSGPTADPAS